VKDLLAFDMDGVLVDVSESYRAAIQETVKHFTGEKPTRAEIQAWKNRGGFNDDWHLSHQMILARGGKTTHAEVVDYFQQIFHGNGSNGLILRERWIAKDGLFERLSSNHTLAIFTGRLRWEAKLTLDRFTKITFDPIVGADDVSRLKPDPEGLLKILGMVEHGKCWYIGDTIDDARAAHAAGVPFVGVGHGNLGEGSFIVLEDINSLEAAIAAHG
jgi:HAD superfamily hydrolase (TIGR01548 family)